MSDRGQDIRELELRNHDLLVVLNEIKEWYYGLSPKTRKRGLTIPNKIFSNISVTRADRVEIMRQCVLAALKVRNRPPGTTEDWSEFDRLQEML